MYFSRWKKTACVVVLALLLATGAHARQLLLPHGETPPGELGFLMAGAQIALASGSEAGWYNPAGLVKESRARLLVGGLGVSEGRVEAGEGSGGFWGTDGGYASWSSGVPRSGRGAKVAFGVFYAAPFKMEFSLDITDERVVDSTALRPSLAQGRNIDILFPDGLTRTEHTTGAGRMESFQPGVAFALKLTEGFRLGFSLKYERLRLESGYASQTSYSGENGAGTAFFSGVNNQAGGLEGDVERWMGAMGVQVDLGKAFTLGVIYEVSGTLGGEGALFYARNETLSISEGGVGTNFSESVLVDEKKVGFDLKRPLKFGLGLAYISDELVVELDILKYAAQSAYQVFPALPSSPDSSTPAEFPATYHSLEGTTHYALGLAFPTGGRNAFLLGMATDVSGVPADDPLFRSIQINTVSGGYYSSKGKLSWSVGGAYRYGSSSQAVFPETEGTTPIEADIQYKALSFRLTGSYLL